MTSKTIAVHVTSLLTGAAGVIALIHPGFTLPSFVQGLVATVCALVVGLLQTYHLASKNTLTANLAALQHIANATVVTLAGTDASSTSVTPVKAIVTPVAPVVSEVQVAGLSTVAPAAVPAFVDPTAVAPAPANDTAVPAAPIA